MLKEYDKKLALKSVVGFLMGTLLLFLPGLKIPYGDDLSQKFFENTITKAAVAYASVRVVNATVSIIQESKLQIEPGGVGVSLAVGQVLDPLNDMAERLSNVLVMAITSLGVQKLAYEISITTTPFILGILLFIFSITLWIKSPKIERLQLFMVQISLLLFIARLCLPISALANHYIYENFFESKIQESKKALQITKIDINTLADMNIQNDDGFWNKITTTTQSLRDKTTKLQEAFSYILENASQLIENLITLTFLYIGIFLIQVILLPIATFWLLLRSFYIFYKI
jgi:ABC-type multidrug transport system fused ATPase/permease subunit